MGCGNDDFSPESLWKLFFCLHEAFWKLQVSNEQIPGNKSDWDLPI